MWRVRVRVRVGEMMGGTVLILRNFNLSRNMSWRVKVKVLSNVLVRKI